MKRQPREALEQLDERERRLFEMKRQHAPVRNSGWIFRWAAVAAAAGAAGYTLYYLLVLQ